MRNRLKATVNYQITVALFTRVRLAILLIFGTIGTGIFGFIVIERYNFIDAFYMTIITLSTVGFMEVHPLSADGRLFTSLLIITNIGIFTFAITSITAFLLDGNVRLFIKDIRVNSLISTLRQHTIVCGYGRTGQQVCEELFNEKKTFVVIEFDENIIEKIRHDARFLFIQGDATVDNVLIQAEIHHAKAIIAALPRDSDNIYITLTARELNSNLKIISRATNPMAEARLKRAGCNHVILPERIGGVFMASIITKPDIIEFFNLLIAPGRTDIYLEEVLSKHLNQSNAPILLKNIPTERLNCSIIIGLRLPDGQFVVNPQPETWVSPDSSLILLGSQEQILNLRQQLNPD